MDFRTTFTIPSASNKIAHDTGIVSIGSCFSTMIGSRLEKRKFKVLNNPFGTIFNPISIFKLLQQAITLLPFEEALVVERDHHFFHYDTHSDLNHPQAEGLMKRLAEQQVLCKEYLSAASHIIITLGTAYVYQMSTTGEIVANCHKQPQRLFDKKLLNLDEMKAAFWDFYRPFRALNPSAEIILTVSPVRHLKDGIPENQLSKSLLRVFVHQMQQEVPHVHYFPSYELMMDDLRDYRYYKEDMIHPTPFAEQYIWKLFSNTYFDRETIHIIRKIESILADLQHKPFHAESKAHQQFLLKLLQKMEQMGPSFDFSKERDAINRQLTTKSSHDDSKSQ